MRKSEVTRKTNETNITLSLSIDGTGQAEINTGSGFFDHMLTLFTRYSRFDLSVSCIGDTAVDYHHSIEDIGIALGIAFKDAVGDKMGISRFSDVMLPMDESLILCAVDISGRAYCHFDLPVSSEKIGEYDTELTEEFFRAFLNNAGVTLHIKKLHGTNSHHITEAAFKAFGMVMRKACKIDNDFSGKYPQQKAYYDCKVQEEKMILFPAIDIYDGKAVRLIKGDYNKMTVYSDNPVNTAESFAAKGAAFLHTVDLMGAKTGENRCVPIIKNIAEKTGMFIQIGGGIRTKETANALIKAGASRIILGTAALLDKEFLSSCLTEHKEKVAVGADINNGFVAIKGWTETSKTPIDTFLDEAENMGVKTVICTDISKDGMMSGTNISLYEELVKKYSLNIIASGGVSSYEDIKKLSEIGVYGAILGKAIYEKKIELEKALSLVGEIYEK